MKEFDTQKIKTLIKSKGFTQEQFAEKIGSNKNNFE